MTIPNFEMMAPVEIADGSDAFTTEELDAVTNLAGEYGIRIEEGDDYRVSAPSNWDADSFVISGWVIPDWDSGDGNIHHLLSVKKDGSNWIELWQSSSDQWQFSMQIAGTSHVASITHSFSAGDAVYVDARWDGTTMTVRVDDNDDGVLETATATPGSTFGDNTGWTFFIGQDRNGNTEFEGAINLLITDDGSASDPGDDRFNGGDGQALEDWLATVNDGGGGKPHAENLVLHVGGNSDGSAVQLDTFAGATKHVDPAGDGDFESDANGDGIGDGWSTPDGDSADFSLSTDADDVQTGSQGQRLNVGPDAASRSLIQSVTINDGKWYVRRVWGRVVSGTNRGNVFWNNHGGTLTAGSQEFDSSSLKQFVNAQRASGDGTAEFKLRGNADTTCAVDAAAAYELATVSASTVDKGVPSRVVLSVSKPGSVYPYIALAVAEDESLELWVRDDSGTQDGPAGGDSTPSTGWHTVGFGYDGSNFFVTVDGVVEATTLTHNGDVDDVTETTIGALRLDDPVHFFGSASTQKIGRALAWDEKLTTDERKSRHNELRDRYSALTKAA